jgi:hypothetical protein
VHHYWSVVENRRVADGRVIQRHVLYLGEISDSQQVAWRRTIEIFDQGENVPRTVALVDAERQIEQDNRAIIRIRLDEMKLCHPRQWGGCWWWSFFMRCLLERVRACNYRTGLAVAKLPLAQ